MPNVIIILDSLMANYTTSSSLIPSLNSQTETSYPFSPSIIITVRGIFSSARNLGFDNDFFPQGLAAYLIAAKMSSLERYGYSLKISSMLHPLDNNSRIK